MKSASASSAISSWHESVYALQHSFERVHASKTIANTTVAAFGLMFCLVNAVGESYKAARIS